MRPSFAALALFVSTACANERPPERPLAVVPAQPPPPASALETPAPSPSATVEKEEPLPPLPAGGAAALAESAGPPTANELAPCTRASIVFVIDRSGSMSGLPMDMAKRSVKGALAAFDATDCAGVIAFDSEPKRVVSIVPVAKRPEMEHGIDRITAGGGTEIASALRMAFVDVKAPTRVKSRAIVLLTDGQSPHGGLRDLADEMAKAKVKLSTIALGSGADEALLRMLADTTSARAYKVTDPNALLGPMKREAELVIKAGKP